MNRHIFFDKVTASIGALMLGKNNFFAHSLQSLTFEEQVAALDIKLPQISGEGIYELKARAIIGEVDPALRIELNGKGKIIQPLSTIMVLTNTPLTLKSLLKIHSIKSL